MINSLLLRRFQQFVKCHNNVIYSNKKITHSSDLAAIHCWAHFRSSDPIRYIGFLVLSVSFRPLTNTDRLINVIIVLFQFEYDELCYSQNTAGLLVSVSMFVPPFLLQRWVRKLNSLLCSMLINKIDPARPSEFAPFSLVLRFLFSQGGHPRSNIFHSNITESYPQTDKKGSIIAWTKFLDFFFECSRPTNNSWHSCPRWLSFFIQCPNNFMTKQLSELSPFFCYDELHSFFL